MPPDVASEGNVDLGLGRGVETELPHVSHHTDYRAGDRITEVGTPLDSLVQRHLAPDRIKTGPERACERFIHYHGRAAAQVTLGEFAPPPERDAHRTDIARGNSHEPDAGITLGVRGAPRELDGRRRSPRREGREVREGDARHTWERPRRVLDLGVQRRKPDRVLRTRGRRRDPERPESLRVESP